jgi:ribosomal protein L20
MDRRFLETMYQQWSNGMNDYAHRWIDFVEMAARVHGTTADQIMKELQKCSWFVKGD